ncbi:DUF4378 domain-containing protein [Cephalotus follicularis]|uniref:DUF4378 domain-containing protein n=1 Tax=Cephalotus follicularis TaxID=3775 RepID=A0A1Q3CUL7_CEPFO|nr:DUF4378 domain-containing protein [Cephalotus follicularis]
MSAKFIHSLSDEIPDLQKQIGCMNGIFQFFDHHHFLGGRRINSQNHKRLPPGQNDKNGAEPNNTSQKSTEKKRNKAAKERKRTSAESPQNSFSSSSCSSSFSSIDCNKSSQQEPSSFSKTVFLETPTKSSPMYHSNAALQTSQQSLDLRDVVKDSIYRDARWIAVKPATKEEAGGQTLKYMDSPRPLQAKDVKGKVQGANESLRVIAKLREAHWYSNERKDCSLASAPKDAPRFSYDGRGSQDTLKSTIKLKELPRLSLDSRVRSMRSSNTEMKSNHILEDLQRRNGNNTILNQQRELGSHNRSSSVVAKLMGLEAFTDPMSTNRNTTEQIKSSIDVHSPFSRSSRTIDQNKQNQDFRSPRNSHKEPISPRLRNPDSVKKLTANSKISIEPAPWKQADGSRGPQKPAFKCQEPQKGRNSSLSVYGEIEKKLAELEFKESGKDLRALKQILAAMQKTKETLETRKEDQDSNLASQTSSERSLNQRLKLANTKNLLSNSASTPSIKGTRSPKSFKSPIVILKPSKLLEKGSTTLNQITPTDSILRLSRLCTGASADNRKESVHKGTAKDLIPRTNHHRDLSSRPARSLNKMIGAKPSHSTPMTKDRQSITGESPNSVRSSGTTSPRLQQKKLILQQQSCPTTPLSDSRRTIKEPSSRQPIELGSPRRLPRPKSPTLQPSDDNFSEIGSEVREMSPQGDTFSLKSESSSSLISQVETEATSTNRFNKINDTFVQHGEKQKNPGARYIEDKSMAEPARAALEQPSPISVLDSSFYRDESPSPVKKISNAFKDDEALNSDGSEWSLKDINHFSSCSKPSQSPESDHREAENIHHMIQNLIKINYAHDATSYHSTNPERRYISEIMFASGLLRDLESDISPIQLHPSGQLINPKLFLALEQTKGRTNGEHIGEKIANSEPIEKIQRKLVFDAVNEILFRKLVLEDSFSQCLSNHKLAGRRPKGQQLLRDLCSEVDHLQAYNFNHSTDTEDDILRSISCQSIDWTDCHSKISGVVLDVERLIFKDLISEVVNCEAAGPRGRPSRHCRQLFSKQNFQM